jgi:hypothetical protein
MFGYSEHFNDFVYEADDLTDFVCFTDQPDLRSPFWDIRVAPRGLLHPARASKKCKILAHRFLADYNCSLYLDNKVRLKQPASRIFDRFLRHPQSPLVCFRHPWRQCVYDEADAVIEICADDPLRVSAQSAFYRRLGYPRQNGLIAGGFLLRRHNDARLRVVMESWYEQIMCHSIRDQLSFNVVAWQHRFEPEYIEIPFLDNDLIECPVVKNGIRVPRDFNDERYVELNPDVTMDPRRHYLLHGALEERRYK